MMRQAREAEGEEMLGVLSLALIGLADAPAQAPPAPSNPHPTSASADPKTCPQPSTNSQTILICTERPQGYRLDPDVMEAKREKKSPGPPVRPGGKVVPDCTNVGPAPCMTAGINLVGAALTAAEMAKRLAQGQEVGSMFVTDPQPSEYQRYEMAKARREAEEAQKAADVKAEAARKAQHAQPQPPSSSAAQPSGN